MSLTKIYPTGTRVMLFSKHSQSSEVFCWLWWQCLLPNKIWPCSFRLQNYFQTITLSFWPNMLY